MKNFNAYLRLMRLDKPVGIALLFLPCTFGIAMAAKQLPDISLSETFRITLLFLIGAVLMRSAGCVMNDLFDRKIDAKVSRTKSRPLATSEIKPSQALILLAALLGLSMLVLMQFNLETILAGCFAFVLVAIYPLMKRITHYPQFFLGIVFNFGVLMSYLAVMQQIDVRITPLYFATVLWTMIYDTIYAYQDAEDDARIGVKSMALKLGDKPQKKLYSLSLLMFAALLVFGWLCDFEANFFLAVLVADLFLNSKIQRCDFKNSASCLKTFKANFWFGILVLIAIIFG